LASTGTVAIECWIVLSLCLIGVFSGQGKAANKEKEMYFAGYKASAVSQTVQFLVLGAIVYYTIWFLYVGMDEMTAPCPQYAFFFAKVVRCSLHSQRLNLLTFFQDMFGWFRTFLKVLFTMTGFFFTLSIFLSCFARRAFSPTTNGPLAFFNTRESSRTDETQSYVNFGIIFVLAFLTVSTELIIKWNDIQDVNSIQSTGQILPVVVGGGGLIRTIWKFCLLITGLEEDE
jgi:hypothetical protein